MKKEINSIKGIFLIILFITILSAVILFFYTTTNDDFFFYNTEKDFEKKEIKEEDIESVAEANNNFAFDLYHVIKEKEKGNIFYSPYSIFSALAMTYEGADEKTREEMGSVLHVPKDEILRSGFYGIYEIVNKREKEYDLNAGNALWVHFDYPFLEEYVDLIEKEYRGKVSNLDFVRKTEISRTTINKYIEEKTNNRIKNLLSEGTLNPLTRMVITNAIYFKGKWKFEFDERETKELDFYIEPETSIKTEIMFMIPEEEKFNYLETEYLQILELPYHGEDVSMFIFLPKESINKIEDVLNFEKIKEYKERMELTKIDGIYLPKFEFDTKYFMKEVLISLGMNDAFFDGVANFSRMDGTRNLVVDNVIHQAYIGVDEQGTEAAGATAVVMRLTSMPEEERIFMANRPFFFIIQENRTEAILFLGRVINPKD
jgi:serpin B